MALAQGFLGGFSPDVSQGCGQMKACPRLENVLPRGARWHGWKLVLAAGKSHTDLSIGLLQSPHDTVASQQDGTHVFYDLVSGIILLQYSTGHSGHHYTTGRGTAQQQHQKWGLWTVISEAGQHSCLSDLPQPLSVPPAQTDFKVSEPKRLWLVASNFVFFMLARSFPPSHLSGESFSSLTEV